MLGNKEVDNSLRSEALRDKISTLKALEQYCGAVSCKLMHQFHT